MMADLPSNGSFEWIFGILGRGIHIEKFPVHFPSTLTGLAERFWSGSLHQLNLLLLLLQLL